MASTVRLSGFGLPGPVDPGRNNYEPHPSTFRLDVLALTSFFLVLGGGTALASYVVSSNSQVGPGTISGHKPPAGSHTTSSPAKCDYVVTRAEGDQPLRFCRSVLVSERAWTSYV